MKIILRPTFDLIAFNFSEVKFSETDHLDVQPMRSIN